MRALVPGAVLATLAVLAGWLWLPPLPPRAGLLWVVPPLLVGIGLVLQSTAGRGLGALGRVLPAKSPLHDLLVLIGLALVAVGLVGLGKLPPPGAGATIALSGRLPSLCHGEPGVRVERETLPILQALDAAMERQEGPVLRQAEEALRAHLPRCVDQVEQAFADPRGTHTSWRQLRDWLLTHPELVQVDPEVAEAPFVPRTHRPRRPRRPVGVELQ